MTIDLNNNKTWTMRSTGYKLKIKDMKAKHRQNTADLLLRKAVEITGRDNEATAQAVVKDSPLYRALTTMPKSADWRAMNGGTAWRAKDGTIFPVKLMTREDAAECLAKLRKDEVATPEGAALIQCLSFQAADDTSRVAFMLLSTRLERPIPSTWNVTTAQAIGEDGAYLQVNAYDQDGVLQGHIEARGASLIEFALDLLESN